MYTHFLGVLLGVASPSPRRRSSTRLRVEPLEARDVPSATPDVDLTTRDSFGSVNDAIFRQADPQPTGTGTIQSFLRIEGAAAHQIVQEGFNTDARPLQFDENKSPQFTRSMGVQDVPVVNLGGVLYREFLLDINQKSSQPLLSLDELRIYVGNARNLTGYDATTHTLAGLTAVYDMDAGGDHWVLLNYRLNSGSGSGDMFLYVPDRLFAGGGPYLYLYSKFGEHYASNSGFQEWAAGRSPLTPVFGSISGTIFNDQNHNGMLDADETGLPDQIVFLDANNNGILDSNEVYTITDQNGFYQFTNLATGQGTQSTFYVRTTSLNGWTDSGDETFVIILSQSGQSVTDLNFAFIPIRN